MKTESPTFAIVNGIRTSHKCIAVCDIVTYGVWGNRRDGYEVNDANYSARDVDLAADMIVSNVPLHPGAADDYRSFPADSASFSVNVAVSFEIPDREIRSALGIGPRVRLDIDGDDMTYYVRRESDGYPIGEVRITSFHPFG